MDLTPELSELEQIALLGSADEFAIPERQISQAELYDEIKLRLGGDGHSDNIRVPKDDLGRVCDNLREILDEVEAQVGRPQVARTYFEERGGNSYSGAAEIYRKARDRYIKPDGLPLAPRLDLVKAAYSALMNEGLANDAIQGCVRLFNGTRVLRQIHDARNPRDLNEAGAALSNAWWTICDALDTELSLSRWFRYVHAEVRREDVPLAQFLGCDCVLDLSRVDATSEFMSGGEWRKGLPVGAWPDTTFKAVVTDGYDALNQMQHVHDLSFAPTVSLFHQRHWEGYGWVWTPGKAEARNQHRLVIWREVQLALLPDASEILAPYLVNRQRVSLYRDGNANSEIAVRYPFTRLFHREGVIPLALDDTQLAVFEARDHLPAADMPIGATDDGKVIMASASTSQFAQVWGARPDVIPLFLRHSQSAADRPVDPLVRSAAQHNPFSGALFALGSLGEVIERATLVPDRAGGIGGLLRHDFLRKVEALRQSSNREFLPSAPFAFEQAWQ